MDAGDLSQHSNQTNVNRKSWEAGAWLTFFLRQERGQYCRNRVGQSKQGSRWSQTRAKCSAVAGEQTVTRSVTQLARVGGVISGKEAKAASQRLSLGSWLLVTTSRPPVPFTMTKTGRYRKRKNKARHCHSEFRPLGEGDRSQLLIQPGWDASVASPMVPVVRE